MRISKPLQIIFILLAWLTLSGRSCTETTITTDVESSQKISDTAGNFEGVLDDNDQFGSAVASIGDLDFDGVTDLAVGAPLDDDGGTDRGAVWILFMNDDGTVDTEQKISDSEGRLTALLQAGLDDNDRFGSAVAELGDLNGDGILDIAVGAPLDDDGGTDRGAVWILFMDTDGTVQFSQKISDNAGIFNSVLQDNDQFGTAIAFIGDLNNDLLPEIAVGAVGDDDGGTDRGAIWILSLAADGTVNNFQKVSDRDGNFTGTLDDSDFFGSSIAGIGDLNADGFEDITVGAIGDDDGGTDRGAVWTLFLNVDSTVLSEQKISETEGNFNGGLTDNDHFGSSVAGIGDYNGDGIVDIAAGAAQDNDGGSDRGAIWIMIMESNGEIISKSKISSTSGNFSGPLTDGDLFGSALADVGDLDLDGITDIVAGAKLDDDGGVDRGALWTLFMQRTETDIDFTLFDNKE
jgi:hypothetical protein